MNKIFLLFLLLFMACNEGEICCSASDIIIPDLYFGEMNSMSRYACISGIEGAEVEVKFMSTEQIRKFKQGKYIIELRFKHDLISDIMEINIEKEKHVVRILDIAFGEIAIIMYKENNQNLDNHDYKYFESVVENISIREFEHTELTFSEKEEPLPMTNGLKSIGGFEFLEVESRKILKLEVSTYDSREYIEKIYDHRDLIQSYLDRGDLLSIYVKKKQEYLLLNSFLVIESFTDEPDENDFCGMGPKTYNFECVYINREYYQ